MTDDTADQITTGREDEAQSDDIGCLADRANHDSPLAVLGWRHGKPDIGYFAVAITASGISTFLSFADVFIIGLGIDALFNSESFTVPLIPEVWIPGEPVALLAFVTGLLVALNLATNLCSFIAEWGLGLFSQRLLHRTRTEIFEAVLALDLAFFEGERTGELLSVLNDDVNQLDSFFTTIINAAVWVAFTLGSALIYMWVLNPQLAVLVLLSAPLVAWLNHRFSRHLDPLQDQVRAERGSFNACLETALSGLPIIKAFTAARFEQQRITAASRKDIEARLNAIQLSVRQPPLNRMVVGVWLLIVTALGVVWVLSGPPDPFSGTLTAGQLVPFLFYLERLTLPMQNLGGVIDGYTSAKASAKRILGVEASGQQSDSEPAKAGPKSQDLEVNSGRVKITNLRFSYPGRHQRALNDISFSAESGDVVGVVGMTGAGKSTFVDLLMRFRNPDAGAIEVDGRDLSEVTGEAVREKIGYVPQDPYVFDGTVRENIAYGGSNVSDDQITRASKLAGAHEFVTSLAEGYETQVGSLGVSLSGGQRQRLAIARAIVDNPPILILDEATSQVDTETEHHIQQSLTKFSENRTMFVVAHRLSMVRGADEIVVLDEGTIVECGAHEELVNQRGVYATLWDIQIGKITAIE